MMNYGRYEDVADYSDFSGESLIKSELLYKGTNFTCVNIEGKLHTKL